MHYSLNPTYPLLLVMRFNRHNIVWKFEFLFCICLPFIVTPPSFAQLVYGASAYEPSERARLLKTFGFSAYRLAFASQESGDLAKAWSGYQKVIGLCGNSRSERWRLAFAYYSPEIFSLCASASRNHGTIYLKINRTHHACVAFKDSIAFGDNSLLPWVSQNCNPMPQPVRLPDWLTQYDS